MSIIPIIDPLGLGLEHDDIMMWLSFSLLCWQNDGTYRDVQSIAQRAIIGHHDNVTSWCQHCWNMIFKWWNYLWCLYHVQRTWYWYHMLFYHLGIMWVWIWIIDQNSGLLVYFGELELFFQRYPFWSSEVYFWEVSKRVYFGSNSVIIDLFWPKLGLFWVILV